MLVTTIYSHLERKDKLAAVHVCFGAFTSTWAELPVLMVYVIDNGEIHAEPNIDVGG